MVHPIQSVSVQQEEQFFDCLEYIDPEEKLSNIEPTEKPVAVLTRLMEETSINESANTNHLLYTDLKSMEANVSEEDIEDALDSIELTPHNQEVYDSLQNYLKNADAYPREFIDRITLQLDIFFSEIMTPVIDVESFEKVDLQYEDLQKNSDLMELKQARVQMLQSQLNAFATAEDLKPLGYQEAELAGQDKLEGLSIMVKSKDDTVETMCLVIDKNFNFPDEKQDLDFNTHFQQVIENNGSKALTDFLKKNESKIETFLFAGSAVAVAQNKTTGISHTNELIQAYGAGGYGGGFNQNYGMRQTYNPPRQTNNIPKPTNYNRPVHVNHKGPNNTAYNNGRSSGASNAVNSYYSRFSGYSLDNRAKYRHISAKPQPPGPRSIGANMNVVRTMGSNSRSFHHKLKEWNKDAKSAASYTKTFNVTMNTVRQQHKPVWLTASTVKQATAQPQRLHVNVGVTPKATLQNYNRNLTQLARTMSKAPVMQPMPKANTLREIHQQNYQLKQQADAMRRRAVQLNDLKLKQIQNEQLVIRARLQISQNAQFKANKSSRQNWADQKNQAPKHSREMRGLLEQRGRPTEKVTSNSMVPKPRQRVNDGSSPGRTTHVQVFVNNQGQKNCRVEYTCPQTGKVKNANIAYNNKGLPVFDDYATFTAKHPPKGSNYMQFKAATKELSTYLKEYPQYEQNYRPDQLDAIHRHQHQIPGLTWHHNAEASPRNFQLLPTNLHDIVKHVGTNSLDEWNK